MAQPRKVLIGYDGSDGAKSALEHLMRHRAGLPDDGVEALVFCVADVWSPMSALSLGADMPMTEAQFEALRSIEQQTVKESRKIALEAVKSLQAACPSWTLRAESCTEAPAWGIIARAEEWHADLIVLGSHGRSALGRIVLGSVSQAVVREASCSVRVVRGRIGARDASACLIIGFDGSADAEAAVEAVAERVWPDGSTVRLVTAINGRVSTAVPLLRRAESRGRPEPTWMHRMIEDPVARLRVAGLAVATVIKRGDPRRVLVEEAKRWGADAIVVGARGFRGIPRFLLGSVSTAIAMQAPCSVEVVRPVLSGARPAFIRPQVQIEESGAQVRRAHAPAEV